MQQLDTSEDIAADLAFMETLRQMKARFQTEVLRASGSDDPTVILSLRQESFFQMAEFLFAIRTYGLDSPEKIERFAKLHNDHLFAIKGDRERMRRYGLSPDRIDAAVFTPENQLKLLANFAAVPPAIDQSDLARFLVTVMSTETCRKLVLATEKAGFLVRVRSPFGAMLVTSNGELEEIYGLVLREARHAATRF